ncbi:transmembrane protein, putative, partial [Bodo saltans]
LNTTSNMMSIGSVYISLNRTNVTGSMWPRVYSDWDTPEVYGSSFALIALEPAAAPPPGYHVVILTGVVGTVVSNGGGLLLAWVPNDGLYVFYNYPNFNGTFSVKNCTLLANPTLPLSLPSLRALRLMLDHVNTSGALVSIGSVSAPPTMVDSSRSAVDDNTGCECREEPRVAICIRICKSFISTPPFSVVFRITPPLVTNESGGGPSIQNSVSQSLSSVMRHASYTTVSIDSSEFISFQNSTVLYTSQPPIFLLDVSGVFLESVVRISNTAVMSSLVNGNTAAYTPPTVMQLSTLQSSKVVVVRATLVNILALLRVSNISSPLDNDVMVSIDVCSRWCTNAASRALPLNCTDFTQVNILNDTVMPAWLDVEILHSACTRSLSQSFSRTITSTRRLSLSRPITTTERNHMTTSATRILTPTVTIPLLSTIEPHVEQPVIVQAIAVGAVAPLAGAVLATGAAGVIQRSSVALRFTNCAWKEAHEKEINSEPPRGEFMAVSENPTRLSFGSKEGAMYRGATVGNTSILIAVCALVLPLGLLHLRLRRRLHNLGASLGGLRLPGRVFVVYAVLLHPTVTAGAGLMMLHLSIADVVLAVIAFLFLSLLAMWFAWAVYRGCSKLVIAAPDGRCNAGLMDYIAGRRIIWIPRKPQLPGTTSNRTWLLEESIDGAVCFAEQFDALIGRINAGGTYRALYFLMGCLWSVVTGVVGALSPNEPTSCLAAQVTLIIVPSLSMISIVIVQSFASSFDRNVNIALELMSFAIGVLSYADVGNSAEAISYVQISLSLLVSTLRILARWSAACLTTTRVTETSESGKLSSQHQLRLQDNVYEKPPPLCIVYPCTIPRRMQLAHLEQLIARAAASGGVVKRGNKQQQLRAACA